MSIQHTSGALYEAVNKIIKYNLKMKLEEHKGLWADELPKVLQAYKMTLRTSTGETPFSLAYGVKAMISMEVGKPSFQREAYNPKENHALICYELVPLEEKSDLAALRTASYKR